MDVRRENTDVRRENTDVRWIGFRPLLTKGQSKLVFVLDKLFPSGLKFASKSQSQT